MDLVPTTIRTSLYSLQTCFPSELWKGCRWLEKRRILKEIRCGMEAEDQEEVVVKAVKELKKSPAKSMAKSMRSSEWSMENRLLYYRGKIYVPRSELHCQILALCHDSKLAGHPGRWKTLELVSRNYWWPQMSRYMLCSIPQTQLHLCLCSRHSVDA